MSKEAIKENSSKEKNQETISEDLKQEILARLRQIGHNGLGLSTKKWGQLVALRDAALLMNDRCNNARAILKANALTPTNAERVLKEIGGITVTDQTIHNNDGFLDKYFQTFEKSEMSRADAQKEVKRLKEKVERLEEKLVKMHRRDADWEDFKIKKEILENDIEELKQDKRDLEARLDRVVTKQKTIIMTQLDLTQQASKDKS